MTNSTLEAVLRRDRLVVAGAVGVIVALAWGYVLWLAAETDIGGMDMTGFRMIPAGMGIMAPANAPWRAIEFAFVFAMWAVMMVGMMAPSATPMILMYARVGRQGKAAGKPLAATGWFASGYFLAWIGFSLAATLVQWVVERAALLDAQMASASNMFGGTVLIAAGAYQWIGKRSAINMVAGGTVIAKATGANMNDIKVDLEETALAYRESFNRQDAAGIAGLYTRGGIHMNPTGPTMDVEGLYNTILKPDSTT